MVAKYFNPEKFEREYEVPDLTGDMVDDFEDFILHDLPVPVDLEAWLETRGIDTNRLRRTIENSYSHRV